MMMMKNMMSGIHKKEHSSRRPQPPWPARPLLLGGTGTALVAIMCLFLLHDDKNLLLSNGAGIGLVVEAFQSSSSYYRSSSPAVVTLNPHNDRLLGPAAATLAIPAGFLYSRHKNDRHWLVTKNQIHHVPSFGVVGLRSKMNAPEHESNPLLSHDEGTMMMEPLGGLDGVSAALSTEMRTMRDYKNNKKTTMASSSTISGSNPLKELTSRLFGSHHQVASIMFAAILAFTLLFSTPWSAEAAVSGGRMGGSFSSSSSRSSYSSRSYSSGGGGGRSTYRAPSSSSRSNSYYYNSRPNSIITVSPLVTPYSTVSPFYNPFFPSPFFFGGGGSGSAGVVTTTYNRGPNILDLLFFGGISWMIFSTIRNAAATKTSTNEMWSSSWDDTIARTTNTISALGPGTSVVQMTISLDVSNRDDRNSILNILDRLSQTAQTDQRVGVQSLTSQVAMELLRRKSSIVSAYSHYQHFNDRTKAQRDYNALAVKERSKFEQETVSMYSGVDYSDRIRSSVPSSKGVSGQATMAVITILMAIDGDSTKLPIIRSIRDVEEALRKIAIDAKVDNCLQSAEILWTPTDRNEMISKQDVIADYPELRVV